MPVQDAMSVSAVVGLVTKASSIEVDADTPLMDAGLDSLAMTEVRNRLQLVVGDGVDLPATLLFDGVMPGLDPRTFECLPAFAL